MHRELLEQEWGPPPAAAGENEDDLETLTSYISDVADEYHNDVHEESIEEEEQEEREWGEEGEEEGEDASDADEGSAALSLPEAVQEFDCDCDCKHKMPPSLLCNFSNQMHRLSQPKRRALIIMLLLPMIRVGSHGEHCFTAPRTKRTWKRKAADREPRVRTSPTYCIAGVEICKAAFIAFSGVGDSVIKHCLKDIKGMTLPVFVMFPVSTHP